MSMTKEEISDNARRIFTREYTALFDLITKEINTTNKMDDAEKLIDEVGKVLNGHQATVVLAVLSVHVINVSQGVHITDAIEQIKMKTDIMIR